MCMIILHYGDCGVRGNSHRAVEAARAAAAAEEKEAEARAYRAMIERVWAENREKRDREAAAWARDYPPPPVPAD